MDMKWLTLGRGFSGYFNELFNSNARWQIWAIGFAALFLFFLCMKMRTAIFFQGYIFTTFLPVIFLINHRAEFYWYVPMLSVCGLAALLTKTVVSIFQSRVTGRAVPVAASIAFAALSLATYRVQRNESEHRRQWQQQTTAEYRAFIASIEAKPQPAANATLYFESYPQYFDPNVLRCAVQVALGRTDIDARLATSAVKN
jgi:hypothetical protein